MNAKLCKVLRAEARALTIGRPVRAYAVEKRRNKRGDLVEAWIINHPHSTRGVYRALKKVERTA